MTLTNKTIAAAFDAAAGQLARKTGDLTPLERISAALIAAGEVIRKADATEEAATKPAPAVVNYSELYMAETYTDHSLSECLLWVRRRSKTIGRAVFALRRINSDWRAILLDVRQIGTEKPFRIERDDRLYYCTDGGEITAHMPNGEQVELQQVVADTLRQMAKQELAQPTYYLAVTNDKAKSWDDANAIAQVAVGADWEHYVIRKTGQAWVIHWLRTFSKPGSAPQAPFVLQEGEIVYRASKTPGHYMDFASAAKEVAPVIDPNPPALLYKRHLDAQHFTTATAAHRVGKELAQSRYLVRAVRRDDTLIYEVIALAIEPARLGQPPIVLGAGETVYLSKSGEVSAMLKEAPKAPEPVTYDQLRRTIQAGCGLIDTQAKADQVAAYLLEHYTVTPKN